MKGQQNKSNIATNLIAHPWDSVVIARLRIVWRRVRVIWRGVSIVRRGLFSKTVIAPAVSLVHSTKNQRLFSSTEDKNKTAEKKKKAELKVSYCGLRCSSIPLNSVSASISDVKLANGAMSVWNK